MSEPAPQLEYAPRPPALAGARLRRWGLLGVLGVLAVGAVILAPKIVGYVSLLQLQRLCLNHTAPPTQVVLETDPADAKKLLAADSRYVANGTMTGLVPRYWTAYHASLGGGFQTCGTVFLHERTTPQGVRCLVAVDANRFPLVPMNSRVDVVSLGARITRPGSVFRGPRGGRSVTRGDGAQVRFDPFDRLTIYAGQADPADASHFTIQYDLAGVRHTVDGWLVDENTVKIELRE